VEPIKYSLCYPRGRSLILLGRIELIDAPCQVATLAEPGSKLLEIVWSHQSTLEQQVAHKVCRACYYIIKDQVAFDVTKAFAVVGRLHTIPSSDVW